MAIDMSQHFTMPALIRYALPSMAMMVFTSVYGIVDGIFVSNFAGKTAFAAVNLIIPYVMMLSVTGFMIGAGGSAIVAKTRGEGHDARANCYFSLLVYFALALGLALSLIGWATMPAVAALLGATGEMLQLAVLYGRISMVSLAFFTLQYVFQAFFVTAGKPGLGFAVIVVAGVVNMLLDALLVGLLGWGVSGAAWATVAGELIGGGAPLLYFFRKNSSFLHLGHTRIEPRIIGKACLNGASELVTNIAVSIVSMIYNLQLLHYIGEDGVAAYGVIMYTWLVFAAIFLGFNIGTSPLVSFQYGAQNRIEMNSLLRKGLGFTAIAGIAMFIAGQLLAEPFSLIFTNYDRHLYDVTVQGFRIFAISFLIMGFSIFGSAFFTALNNGIVSALISFMRTLVFETAAVIVLPIIFGIDGIWFSVTVAEVLACALTAFLIVWLSERYGYMHPRPDKR